MHMWQIHPGAHDHLIDVIRDALALSSPQHGAKVEIANGVPTTPDGTIVVTADTDPMAQAGQTDRHVGVTLNLLDKVNPKTVEPQHLDQLLRVSLNWRKLVVITTETDPDEGECWFIQHPITSTQGASGRP